VSTSEHSVGKHIIFAPLIFVTKTAELGWQMINPGTRPRVVEKGKNNPKRGRKGGKGLQLTVMDSIPRTAFALSDQEGLFHTGEGAAIGAGEAGV